MAREYNTDWQTYATDHNISLYQLEQDQEKAFDLLEKTGYATQQHFDVDCAFHYFPAEACYRFVMGPSVPDDLEQDLPQLVDLIQKHAPHDAANIKLSRSGNSVGISMSATNNLKTVSRIINAIDLVMHPAVFEEGFEVFEKALKDHLNGPFGKIFRRLQFAGKCLKRRVKGTSKVKSAIHSAFKAARDDKKLTLWVGLAQNQTGEVVIHAWNTNQKGNIIDSTPTNVKYFGMKIPAPGPRVKLTTDDDEKILLGFQWGSEPLITLPDAPWENPLDLTDVVEKRQYLVAILATLAEPHFLKMKNPDWNARAWDVLCKAGARTDIALNYACMSKTPDSLKIVKMLVERAPESVNATSTNGFTPLMHAVSNPSVTRFLIDHEADINAVAENDGLRLTAFTIAVLAQQNDVAEMMVRKPLDLTILVGKDIVRPQFIDAIANDASISLVKKLLDYDPDAINFRDATNLTALHYATFRTDGVDISMLLLKSGADPMARDIFGYTPLTYATKKIETRSIIPVASVLYAHGATLSKQRALELAMHLVLDHRSTYQLRRISIVAALQEQKIHASLFNDKAATHIVKLCETPANISATTVVGDTLLHLVTLHKNAKLRVRCAEILCRNQADVTAQNWFGETPLMSAIIDRDWQVVDILCRRYRDLALDATTLSGDTAMHFVAQLLPESLETARTLLKLTPPPSLMKLNADGDSPYTIAVGISKTSPAVKNFVVKTLKPAYAAELRASLKPKTTATAASPIQLTPTKPKIKHPTLAQIRSAGGLRLTGPDGVATVFTKLGYGDFVSTDHPNPIDFTDNDATNGVYGGTWGPDTFGISWAQEEWRLNTRDTRQSYTVEFLSSDDAATTKMRATITKQDAKLPPDSPQRKNKKKRRPTVASGGGARAKLFTPSNPTIQVWIGQRNPQDPDFISQPFELISGTETLANTLQDAGIRLHTSVQRLDEYATNVVRQLTRDQPEVAPKKFILNDRLPEFLETVETTFGSKVKHSFKTSVAKHRLFMLQLEDERYVVWGVGEHTGKGTSEYKMFGIPHAIKEFVDNSSPVFGRVSINLKAEFIDLACTF